MMKNPKISRRSILKTSAAFGAAAGFPVIVPSTVFGQNAPSNRIVMGSIGTGSQGTGNMKAFLNAPGTQLVAVCDVDKKHRERAKTEIDKKYGNTDCATYNDFRELIARGDLDAVHHALPDHWHAAISIAAANAGLDIYGQKPLARSIREGRAICDAVHRNGIVWQTGSQQRSDTRFRFACELVRNGYIGRIVKTEVGLPGGKSTGGDPTPIPVPDGLDWNLWLGPAPAQPCRNLGHKTGGPHWNWRWVRDFSGGQITDWSGHHIDIAQWGLGFERTGPVEITGKGLTAEGGFYNVIYDYSFDLKYANGQHINVSNHNTKGVKWIGEDGWIYVTRGKIDASNPKLLKQEIGPNEIHLYKSPNHTTDFLNCVRSRKEPVAPVEIGHRSISAGLLGEIAIYTGRKLKWNPDTEELIGDPEASALLGRSYREPWIL